MSCCCGDWYFSTVSTRENTAACILSSVSFHQRSFDDCRAAGLIFMYCVSGGCIYSYELLWNRISSSRIGDAGSGSSRASCRVFTILMPLYSNTSIRFSFTSWMIALSSANVFFIIPTIRDCRLCGDRQSLSRLVVFRIPRTRFEPLTGLRDTYSCMRISKRIGSCLNND